ncbi:MAG: Gfo/Idh/MocA family oxidoreductase [Armatimonadetes bacterium]|nr:Gfo/Idh/MocA family oxidoreductase [Armatimonadota bacterium]
MGSEGKGTIGRRDFLKTTAGLGAAAVAGSFLGGSFGTAQGNDKLRIGLIGCGGRGNGTAHQACEAGGEQMEVYALGDLFKDRLDGAFNSLKGRGAQFNVTPERCFTGFDAYQKVLETGVNYVILATPPGFRPVHFKAAIEAGAHVFMEKPVAVCPTGVRQMLEAGKLATERQLGVVAGTQRRHQRSYVETIKRLHGGAIGKIQAMQVYWNQGGLWAHSHEDHKDWSDVEWQIRNWLYFTWVSGDHIVEQHVHNLDVANWVLQNHPTDVVCLGGRQSRTDARFGHIYDHFAADFNYPDGVKVLSMCRQVDGCENNVGEHAIGAEGVSGPGGWIRGKENYGHKGDGDPDAYVQEHRDLIESIRAGTPLNETQQVTESTLCAIMARMSAYTGKKVAWDWVLNESKLDLLSRARDLADFGDLAVDEVAVPGRTPLV